MSSMSAGIQRPIPDRLTRHLYGLLRGLTSLLGDRGDGVLILAADVRGPREGKGREVKGDEGELVDHFD